jgi:hypothetical protein
MNNNKDLGEPDLPSKELDSGEFLDYPEPNEALCKLMSGGMDIPRVYDPRKFQTEIRDLALDFCLSTKNVDTVERFITKIIELANYYQQEEK